MILSYTDRIARSFALTRELFTEMEAEQLKLKMGHLSSNTLGEQVWCIIGARESYFNAIKNSKWSGFNSSLNDYFNLKEVNDLLLRTETQIIDYLANTDLPPQSQEFLFDLLEHEIQHHGQLIRYWYANKIKFPESWNRRYTV